MVDVKLARAPVPEGEPSDWLVREVLQQGAISLPCVVTAIAGEERLVALPEQEDAELGHVEGAVLRQFDVDWVGAWGTAVIERDGNPNLVTFARIRHTDGTVFAEIWPRIPGAAPMAELSERYEGPQSSAPSWIRALFPKLSDGGVRFVNWEWKREEWPGNGAIPEPDFAEDVGEERELRDVLHQAAETLQTMFINGQTRPALVAWHTEGMATWVAEAHQGPDALHALGARIAADDRTLALGIFGVGEDEGLEPPAHLIALAMESRAGIRLMWLRRFRVGEDSNANWIDEGGIVREPGPELGWFG